MTPRCNASLLTVHGAGDGDPQHEALVIGGNGLKGGPFVNVRDLTRYVSTTVTLLEHCPQVTRLPLPLLGGRSRGEPRIGSEESEKLNG